jgi:DNA transposition AAA+ family ATPase
MVRQLPDSVCEAVRADLNVFLASRPDLSMTDLTAYTALSERTGRAFASGGIPGGRQVVSEYQRVLEQARAGEILQPGAGGRGTSVLTEDTTKRVRKVRKAANFYETQTVRRVAEVLEFCEQNAAIGVITADFGVGKTEAVGAWRRANPTTESLVFEFDEFSCGNKVAFIQSLARMLGLDYAPGSWNGGIIFADVCARLRVTPCLLIFDQCELVRVKVFQVIRQLHDRTHDAGVGVVLLAAPILMTRMNQSRRDDLGALTSRVGIWAPLSGVTKTEMAAIVKQEGLTDIEEPAFDLWWKATGGSMRRLMRAMDLLKAKHAGKRITEKTIAGVAGNLWGMTIEVGRAEASPSA